MRRLTLPVSILLCTLFAPAAFGQQITDALRVSRPGLHYNAKALGMGNAYSTLGYDFSALLFNPATMAASDKFSWTVTANANAFRSSTDYYGNKTDFTTSNMSGDQTGLTMPFRLDSTRALVIGLGYTQSTDYNHGFKYLGLNGGSEFPSFIQVLAGRDDPTSRALGLSYPAFDGSGNPLGDQTVLSDSLFEGGYLLGEGGMSHYSVGAAVEAAENVFFGVSASYNSGHYTSDLELNANDINDVYPVGTQTVPGDPSTDGFESATVRNVRDKEYRGWDARFGVMYRIHNFIGVSASFDLPSAHKVTEESFVSGSSEFAAGSFVAPETRTVTTYHFKPPAEMTVGAMVNMWIITGTAQATFVDYAAMKLTSGASSVSEQTRINKDIRDQLQSVVNLNVGAEVRLPFTGLSARAGALYHPSPYAADSSRFAQKAVTLGFGINSSDMLQFDIGYGYSWRGENKNQQTGEPLNTDEKNGYHTALFTMRVSF